MGADIHRPEEVPIGVVQAEAPGVLEEGITVPLEGPVEQDAFHPRLGAVLITGTSTGAHPNVIR